MRIEITFTSEDLREILAEHCKKQFDIDPEIVDLPPEFNKKEYLAKVMGKYRPE